MDKTVQFLQNTEVFRGLSENQLQDVKNSFKKVSLKKEEPIVYLGDESDSVFLIKEGLCKVFIPLTLAWEKTFSLTSKKGSFLEKWG